MTDAGPLVIDTSALVALATIETLDRVLDEYAVHTTATVVDELEAMAEHDDGDAAAAGRTLVAVEAERLAVHPVDDPPTTSRVDAGEGSCAVLADEIDAAFLLTDDLRALPELERLVDCRVAISPIVLLALVRRGVLERSEARARVAELAERRGWLGAPIHRRALALFEEE